jgi:hypothetical protein
VCRIKVIFLRVLPKFNVGSEPDWDKLPLATRQVINTVTPRFSEAFDRLVHNPSKYTKIELVGINTELEVYTDPNVVSFACISCGGVPTIACEECGFSRFCGDDCLAAAADSSHNAEMCRAYKVCTTAALRNSCGLVGHDWSGPHMYTNSVFEGLLLPVIDALEPW